MPFWLLPEITLPSGITPPTWVFADEPETSSPFAVIGHDRGVVGPDAHEVGLDRRVVGVGDPQAVAAVAAEHVVVDERLSWKVQPISDCRWPSTMATPSCAVAQGRVARGGRADEVAAQRVLGGPAVDEHAVVAVARDQVALRRPDEHAAPWGRCRPMPGRRSCSSTRPG